MINRRKTSLALIILAEGLMLFSLALGNHLYNLTRVKLAKRVVNALPKRVSELDEELGILENEPNKATRKYWEVFQEALKYDREFDVWEKIHEEELRVNKYNQSIPLTRGLGITGLALALGGYFLKTREESS